MYQYLRFILIIAPLTLASCSSFQLDNPDLEPFAFDNTARVCINTNNGVYCGEQPCEQSGDWWSCPNNRTCRGMADGLGGMTLLCQQTPEEQAQEEPDDQPEPAGGGTVVRPPEPPPTAPPDESITRSTPECDVGVIAKVRLRRGQRLTETHNLAHGFSEVVVPYRHSAVVRFLPSPDDTRPYDGEMNALWDIPNFKNVFIGKASKSKSDIRRWQEKKSQSFTPDTRPTIQRHVISAHWKSEGTDEEESVECDLAYPFTVTFAEQIQDPPRLNLERFMRDAENNNFRGTPQTGTRVFHELPRPVPRSRPDKVIVPIGYFWELPEDCCGINNAARKVVQFARAAIHGPNGRLGKKWSLDILPSELPKAQNNPPEHDPTYTGRPRSDRDDRIRRNGSGGTRRDGNNVHQWDAPGMPRSLYDRLFAAQGASTYRQQFLSLLVCRPNTGAAKLRHRVDYYLQNAGVKQIAVTTVRWNFHGQRGITRPQQNYRQPTIQVSFQVRDGNCTNLQQFLDANGLTETFRKPESDSRDLEILSAEPYDELAREVTRWEQNPFNHIQIP